MPAPAACLVCRGTQAHVLFKKGGKDFVRCEACGTYLPTSEAKATATGFRCGDPACPRRR